MSVVATQMRSGRKQTVLNMVTTVISQFLSLGISFFLTPYIVTKLGAAAYGFLGLSNNIIGYTALITVALNSMSGRFITIEYHKGDYIEANRYLSSTTFANFFLAIVITLSLGIVTLFLEELINIPTELVPDVKFLFTLLFVNTSLGLCTGCFGMPLFIKNRLDIGNSLGVAYNILRVILTILAYGLLPAHIWYIGAIGLIISCVSIGSNYYLYKHYTPEFAIKLSYFQARKVWEMIREGAWNLLSQFSSILNQGLELLLTNIFVGAYFMGVLSITKSLPFVILGIFTALGGNFHPECVKLYADNDMDGLRKLLVKGIRILGALSTIPCAGVFAFGDVFYHSWMPGQDMNLLYHLSVITMVWLLTTLPTQTLWYIFTLTKTVRYSSVVLIKYGLVNFILTVLVINLLSDDISKLFAVVIIQSVLGILRFTTFLPFFGARVLGLPRYTFLVPLLKTILTTAVLTALCLVFKFVFIQEYSWTTLIMGAIFTVLAGVVVNSVMTLTRADRDFILVRILKIKRA